MPGVVVDTDVLSFQFKGDSRAPLYDPHVVGRIVVLSFMTVAELDYWAIRRRWGQARRHRLNQHLGRFLLSPFDRALCSIWAELRDEAERNGRPIGIADAWIAATAIRHGVPLVTHNPGDYAGLSRLQVISEAGP